MAFVSKGPPSPMTSPGLALHGLLMNLFPSCAARESSARSHVPLRWPWACTYVVAEDIPWLTVATQLQPIAGRNGFIDRRPHGRPGSVRPILAISAESFLVTPARPPTRPSLLTTSRILGGWPANAWFPVCTSAGSSYLHKTFGLKTSTPSELREDTWWHDPMTDIVWRYQFMYHTSDRSIEMKTSERETDEEFDIKNQKTFLKRVAYPAISLEQLYIGSTILVYTRQLLIEDYGDDFTCKHLRGLQETTCAMIKPDAICHAGKILECITSNGLLVKHMRMCQLSQKQAEEFYKVHQGKPFYEALILLVSSGPVIALELVGENALCRWRLLLGPTSTEVARIKAPSSIRAQYGTDTTKNACHGSDSHENARIETLFFFKCWNMGMCARFKNCSLCIIKPHVVMSDCGGAILDRIQQKFDVTALELAHFNRPAAADFLEVYQGICPDFFSMTHELASGDFIIVEVCDKTSPCSNPVNKFREFCGPADSCIARALRPQSLRAEFGINKVKNAVHCTDIPEDGELEVGYMFTHQWEGK